VEADDTRFTPAHWQKQTLRVANFMLLGIECCLCTRNYVLGKRLVAEAYNLLEGFIAM
jgi:hypothetical protein